VNVSVGVHTRIGCTRWQVIGATPSARLAEPRSRERVAEMIDFAGLGEWLDGDVSTLAFALERGVCRTRRADRPFHPLLRSVAATGL